MVIIAQVKWSKKASRWDTPRADIVEGGIDARSINTKTQNAGWQNAIYKRAKMPGSTSENLATTGL